MKQYKLSKKNTSNPPSGGNRSTRQEIDEIAKHIAVHIEKNPAKAARLFENWLNGRPRDGVKKKAA
jgi:hypothetical protein